MSEIKSFSDYTSKYNSNVDFFQRCLVEHQIVHQ